MRLPSLQPEYPDDKAHQEQESECVGGSDRDYEYRRRCANGDQHAQGHQEAGDLEMHFRFRFSLPA